MKRRTLFTLSLIRNVFRHKGMSGKVLLLLVVLLIGGTTVLGCVGRGAQPKGWSGVAVADGTLFLGSMEGKVVAVDVSSHSRLHGDVALETLQRGGGFGCAPASTAVAIYGTPAVSGDLVYVGGYDGRIRAISSGSVTLRWVYPKEGNLQQVVGGLVVSQGKVCFGSSDGKLYALDAVSGDKEWEFQTGDKIWSTPAVDGDTLYIGSFDRKLYAVSIADGSKKWEFDTEGAIAGTPLVYDDTVYVGSFDRHVYAVHTNGSLKWKSAVEADNWFWTRPVAVGNVIYAACLDGKLYAIAAEDGSRVAEFDLGSPISSSPVSVDNSVVIASEVGEVYIVDTSTNQVKLLADVEEDTYAPLSASEGVVYVHTQKRDTLYALDAQTGTRLWSLTLGSK